MNNTAPLGYREPFWSICRLTRTSDPPLSFLEYLNDYLLYVHLKNPPPWNTATYVVSEEE